MANHESRFAWVVRLAKIALIGYLVFAGLGLIAVVATYVIQGLETGAWMRLDYLLGVAGLLASIAWVFVLYGLAKVFVAGEAASATVAGRLGAVETLLEGQGNALSRLAEVSTLSDLARSIVYRDDEIASLREAVHERIMRQDYAAAESLITEIETKGGYAQEGAHMRQMLQDARKATLDEKIDAGLARVQTMIDADDWDNAARTAQRLLQIFPGHAKITALPGAILAQRNEHKRELLKLYGEAVSKNDIERGIELLKELDRYLTPQEGAALQESARGVFKAKLHNLGVQFAICVTDERWAQAVNAGEEIIRDYPNSRMAHEVRQKMDQLRSRAAGMAKAAS